MKPTAIAETDVPQPQPRISRASKNESRARQRIGLTTRVPTSDRPPNTANGPHYFRGK